MRTLLHIFHVIQVTISLINNYTVLDEKNVCCLFNHSQNGCFMSWMGRGLDIQAPHPANLAITQLQLI